MSRIGKQPVEIPSGVEVSVTGNTVAVKGPKGSIDWQILNGVGVEVVGSSVQVSREGTDSQAAANFGTARALVNNMVIGVTKGWTRKLTLSGVGYNAKCTGKVLTLVVGYSHDVNLDVPEKIACNASGTSIELESVDKNLVGTFAAKVRGVRPPEPYLGKGIRYEDEVVRRKAGKTGR